jgi:hypothetical protein
MELYIHLHYYLIDGFLFFKAKKFNLFSLHLLIHLIFKYSFDFIPFKSNLSKTLELFEVFLKQ